LAALALGGKDDRFGGEFGSTKGMVKVGIAAAFPAAVM
jgi:hypothetical protein